VISQPFSLVATLGPASWTLAPDLRRAGATAFRINASHVDPPQLAEHLDGLRSALPDADVVIDLQGAKMRLGALAPVDVALDERVSFAVDGRGGHPLPHPELFVQARVGDTISVDDGRVHFRVDAAGPGRLEATALDPGRLLPRKGVNLLQHPVRLEGLTAGDRDVIDVARRHEVATFAFSFMLDGREAGWVRAAAPGCRVVGKIERREAADALAVIADCSDAVWICRGDLGAQLGSGALGRFVASVAPRGVRCPVLMAGQVAEHLTRHREPTRSEVCHLFDLVSRGYAGLVLSDETAVGDDPVNAVVATASLLRSFHSLNAAG
jgi:pyruvate kinase